MKNTNEISAFPRLIKFWSPIFYPNIFEFQIATKAKGRGVQRLLLLAQRINLLGIPAMAVLVFVHAVYPSENMSYITCFLVRMATLLLATNRMLSEPTVVLGRYVNLSQCNSIHKGWKFFYLFRLFYLHLPAYKERIGDIAEELPDGTDEQRLPDDNPATGREAGLGTEDSPSVGPHLGLPGGLDLQPPQVASQNEVSASVVALPSKPDQEEPRLQRRAGDIGGQFAVAHGEMRAG